MFDCLDFRRFLARITIGSKLKKPRYVIYWNSPVHHQLLGQTDNEWNRELTCMSCTRSRLSMCGGTGIFCHLNSSLTKCFVERRSCMADRTNKVNLVLLSSFMFNLETFKRERSMKRRKAKQSYQIRRWRLNTAQGLDNLSDFSIFTLREPHWWRIRIRFLLNNGTLKLEHF